MPSHSRSFPRVWIALILAALLVLGLSVFVGRYPAPYWLPLERLRVDPLAQRLVWGLRLPRLLGAFLVGAALAASGTVMQGLFRNPLVEPGFLGVSQGAAFGAALCILYFGTSPFWVQLSATLFALLGLILSTFLASHLRYGGWVLRMVFAGIATSALFTAAVGLLKYMAYPLTQLPEITFWMLGGLAATRWQNSPGDPASRAPCAGCTLADALAVERVGAGGEDCLLSGRHSSPRACTLPVPCSGGDGLGGFFGRHRGMGRASRPSPGSPALWRQHTARPARGRTCRRHSHPGL